MRGEGRKRRWGGGGNVRGEGRKRRWGGGGAAGKACLGGDVAQMVLAVVGDAAEGGLQVLVLVAGGDLHHHPARPWPPSRPSLTCGGAQGW